MLRNFQEVCCVDRVCEVSSERSFQWIVNLDLDVVNSRLGILMEFFIDSNRVRKLERYEWSHMWNERIGNVRDVAFFSTDEL